MRINITSAAGVLALLDEPDDQLKIFALKKLNQIVDIFWAEISDAVDKIEVLYESSAFACRELAALVASKVYYHLGAFDESLAFALGAGSLFDINESSEYVETIVAKSIDQYTKIRVENHDTEEIYHKAIDPRLESIVDRMFRRCFEDRQFKQAVGISLETRRLDIFEKAICESDDIAGTLSYSLKVCMSLVQSRQLRIEVLRVLVKLYTTLAVPDYISVCQCLIFLDDAQVCADILGKLVRGDTDTVLMAYQIGFDLYESATQQFILRVQASLRAASPVPLAPASGKSEAAATDSSELPQQESSATTAAAAAEAPAPGAAAAATPTAPAKQLTEEEKALVERLERLLTILGGEPTRALRLQFLIRNNKADLLILKNTKDAVRNSVCHTATVMANAFMHCGTTCDQFLRDNLDWLGKATNWAKFTATASLGVIHKGHEKDSLNLMSTYLPKDAAAGSSPYSEGGGLFALGLIHANHGGTITDYLLSQLKDATNEHVRHGGCLGLGLAALSTARMDVYEQLKSNLYQDDAVTGEAAGIAMGLVMMGTHSAGAIEDMVMYAKETQHEKILRGLALGIALVMYGRLEEADTMVDSLQRDKDPILRWSAMYTVAMAYAGTANNGAIRRLLHVAVSDVNDDVRRAAVTALGFLLFRTPDQCPSVVSLLSESYNPHVRYGAAMALGIACAGTGLKEAIALLEPMTNDPVNYVRQGALIASALVLVQQTENTNSKVKQFRELYAKVISVKHEDVMAKFGAVLAQGIIDAGGRNVTVSLQSRTGHTNMEAIVGLLVFQQFWYWFPLTNFLSLAFTPTALIALNAELKMPKLEFISNARPSVYGYPPPLEEKKDRVKEKVETVVLSITAKQRRKKGAAATAAPDASGKEKEEKMEVDDEKKDAKDGNAQPPESSSAELVSPTPTPTETSAPSLPPAAEPAFEILSNPARVMRQQLKVLAMAPESRYATVKPITVGGIIMLRDGKPAEREDLVVPVEAGGPKHEEEEDEPEPPEPFPWPDYL